MPFRIAIDFPSATLDEIHRIRNFGEELHRELKADGSAEISLGDVDRATDQVLVTVFHRRGRITIWTRSGRFLGWRAPSPSLTPP